LAIFGHFGRFSNFCGSVEPFFNEFCFEVKKNQKEYEKVIKKLNLKKRA